MADKAAFLKEFLEVNIRPNAAIERLSKGRSLARPKKCSERYEPVFIHYTMPMCAFGTVTTPAPAAFVAPSANFLATPLTGATISSDVFLPFAAS